MITRRTQASEWARRLSSPSMDGRGAATHQASQCGAALVPVLVEIITGKNEHGHPWDGSSRRGAVIALGLMGAQAAPAAAVLASVLEDGADVIRADAAAALGCLGAAARATQPTVLAALKTSESLDVCFEAARSLTALVGEKAVVALLDVLTDESGTRPAGRIAAAHALGQLGARALDAVPILTHLLDDPHPGLQAGAAAALQRLRGPGP